MQGLHMHYSNMRVPLDIQPASRSDVCPSQHCVSATCLFLDTIEFPLTMALQYKSVPAADDLFMQAHK